jgi:hypothetical protein
VPTEPHLHLQAAARQYRHVWRQYESFRADRGRGLPDWPEWCYCPLAASYAIVSGGSDRQLSLEEASDIARLGALAAWRVTQGVYRYDPDLFAELVAAPIDGEVPAEVLYRLPEWCVYVEAEQLGIAGFFAHLEHDPNDGRAELRLLLDYGDRLVAVPIHLGGSLADGLRGADREASMRLALRDDRQVASESFGLTAGEPLLTPFVNLVLYLCSVEPDLGDHPPTRPHEAKGPRGPRIEIPPRPVVHETGYRIGAALRRVAGSSSAATGTGRPPIPHVRRAHWHTYWVGPRDDQHRELRWISPTLVGAESTDDIGPVVRPVRE